MGSLLSYPGVKREANADMRSNVGSYENFLDGELVCGFEKLSEKHQGDLVAEMGGMWPHFRFSRGYDGCEGDKYPVLKVESHYKNFK